MARTKSSCRMSTGSKVVRHTPGQAFPPPPKEAGNAKEGKKEEGSAQDSKQKRGCKGFVQEGREQEVLACAGTLQK